MRWYADFLKNTITWVLVISAILAALSLFLTSNFLESFRSSLFYFGLFLIVAGGLVGAGFSEVAYYGSYMYRVSNTYMESINGERRERRDRQFSFMVYSLVVGFILIFLAMIF